MEGTPALGGDPGLAAADNRQVSGGATDPEANVLTALSRQLYSPGCHRAPLASHLEEENVVGGKW